MVIFPQEEIDCLAATWYTKASMWEKRKKNESRVTTALAMAVSSRMNEDYNDHDWYLSYFALANNTVATYF